MDVQNLLSPDLVQVVARRRAQQLSALEDLVTCESPTDDRDAVQKCARLAVDMFQPFCTEVTLIERTSSDSPPRRMAPVVEALLSSSSPGKPIVLIGHLDTVHPLGTLKKVPFRIEEDRAYGPGILDMKAGVVCMREILWTLRNYAVPLAHPIRIVLVGDEELGSATSRDRLEAAFDGARCALVFEPGFTDGRIKTARKGVGGFTLRVKGRAAHAGTGAEHGASAIHELAHQISEIVNLADPKVGRSVNVGIVRGGTRRNVVAAEAACGIDVRVTSNRDATTVESALRALKPRTPETELKVTGGFGRPPMPRTAESGELAQLLARVGSAIGIPVREGRSGGASDGNLAVHRGVAALDGLGPYGGGAHSESEFVDIASISSRAALVAGLIAHLSQ